MWLTKDGGRTITDPLAHFSSVVIRCLVNGGLLAGGAGGTFGRNIEQAAHPARMAAALAGIIHCEAKVEEAMRTLEPGEKYD